jgi:hypothetical protein
MRPNTSWIARGTIIITIFMIVGAVHIAFWLWPFNGLMEASGGRHVLGVLGIIFTFGTMIYYESRRRFIASDGRSAALAQRRVCAAFHQRPRIFHQRPPIPSQMIIFTTLISAPSFHQSASLTYPEPNSTGAGPVL